VIGRSTADFRNDHTSRQRSGKLPKFSTAEATQLKMVLIGVPNASVDRSQSTNQWLLLPQNVRVLVQPTIALWRKFEIESVQNLGHDETHLVVRHAA
jgi:hypothetical protein